MKPINRREFLKLINDKKYNKNYKRMSIALTDFSLDKKLFIH